MKSCKQTLLVTKKKAPAGTFCVQSSPESVNGTRSPYGRAIYKTPPPLWSCFPCRNPPPHHRAILGGGVSPSKSRAHHRGVFLTIAKNGMVPKGRGANFGKLCSRHCVDGREFKPRLRSSRGRCTLSLRPCTQCATDPTAVCGGRHTSEPPLSTADPEKGTLSIWILR